MWYRDNVRHAIKQCYRSQREHSKRLANPKTQRQKFVDSKQNSKSLASMDLHSRINKGRKGQTERRNLLQPKSTMSQDYQVFSKAIKSRQNIMDELALEKGCYTAGELDK